MMNPYEHDETPLEPDEGRYSACSCGHSGCLLDGHDPSNVHVNGRWYTVECAAALPQVIDGRDDASRADVVRDDDFEQVRR